MNPITENIQHVRALMIDCEKKYHRPDGSVRLLAVSKNQSAENIALMYQQGQCAFGENFLQEALKKIHALAYLPNLEWHYIGHIQSNKTKKIATHFSWVQSVCRIQIAKRLHEHRLPDLPPLNICIEVNVDEERNKSGILLKECLDFAHALKPLSGLRLRGLMAIPKIKNDFSEQLASFRKLRHVYDTLKLHGFTLDTLSMGMSQDFAAAIAAGATMVRIGTMIFGERHDSN